MTSAGTRRRRQRVDAGFAVLPVAAAMGLLLLVLALASAGAVAGLVG